MLKCRPLVPSRAVLRVLTNLAIVSTLGSTAVLVEDRRRRIAALRRMQTNAAVLKSSTRYCPNDVSKTVLRVKTLAFEAHLDQAEAMLMSALSDSAPPQALRQCYDALLASMWRNTRDFRETQALFERLEARFTRLKPSVSFFNRMIRACLDVRDEDAARYYLRIMTDKYGLEPDVTSLGHLLLPAARRHDWQDVNRGFREMKTLFAAQRGFRAHFAKVFAPIFIEHLRENSLEQSLQFLQTAMDEYGFALDQRLFNIVVTWCVKLEAIELLKRWISIAKSFGLRVEAGTIEALLKRFWFEGVKDSSRLLGLLYRIRRIDESLISRKCATMVEDFVTSTERPFTKWSLPTNDDRSDDTPGLKLLSQMRRQVMYDGEPAAAVNSYTTMVSTGVEVPQKVLGYAMMASLQSTGGDINAAEALLRSASRPMTSFAEALMPLLIHKMRNTQCVFGRIRDVVMSFYRRLEERRAPILHHVVTCAARRLVDSSQPREAVRLLGEVHQSLWAKYQPFGIDCMTVYLQAYSALQYTDGICWVVAQVLELDLVIDTDFYRALKVVCKTTVQNMVRKPNHHHHHTSSTTTTTTTTTRQDLALAKLQLHFDCLRRRWLYQKRCHHRRFANIVWLAKMVAQEKQQEETKAKAKALPHSSPAILDNDDPSSSSSFRTDNDDPPHMKKPPPPPPPSPPPPPTTTSPPLMSITTTTTSTPPSSPPSPDDIRTRSSSSCTTHEVSMMHHHYHHPWSVPFQDNKRKVLSLSVSVVG